ncbi:hypothetical protein D3C71_2127520 [compost metagenome]
MRKYYRIVSDLSLRNVEFTYKLIDETIFVFCGSEVLDGFLMGKDIDLMMDMMMKER